MLPEEKIKGVENKIMAREKILLSGEPNTSKTVSLLSLVNFFPDNKIVIFDPDDGVAKAIEELGLEGTSNLVLEKVGNNWEELIEKYKAYRASLVEGDWLCFDMLGRFWDLVQSYYSSAVFGESPIEHLMQLRKQAKNVSFGGFEGLTDWVLIKRLHNEMIMDDAVLNAPFNVMATTSVNSYLPVETVPKTGVKGIYATEFGIKPEGEKHNIYRYDTQAVMYRKKTGTYHFRLMRDRGRAVDVKQEFDITGKSFWEVYSEYRGI